MIRTLERLSQVAGRMVAWLTLAMVLLTFTIVVMRYVFDAGFIWMQEIVTWMHAAVFMLGAAYALGEDQHVRVDVFYREMPERRKAIVDIAGVILLLLPLMAYFAWESWDYVRASWQIREGSRQAQGLPYPAMSLLKSFLLIMPALVAIESVAMLLRAARRLRGDALPERERESLSGPEL